MSVNDGKQAEPEPAQQSGNVFHRLTKVENRVDNIEQYTVPMVQNHENVIYRGTPGQPSMISHIADTNTKLDYNNKRLDDMVAIGTAILNFIKSASFKHIAGVFALLLALGVWATLGSLIHQKLHQWFPAIPIASTSKTLGADSSSGLPSGQKPVEDAKQPLPVVPHTP